VDYQKKYALKETAWDLFIGIATAVVVGLFVTIILLNIAAPKDFVCTKVKHSIKYVPQYSKHKLYM